MKTKVFFIAILVIAVLFTSCTDDEFTEIPSANISTKSIEISHVSKLIAEDLFTVYVNFSETEESAIVEVNENLDHLLEAKQMGESFYVGLKDDSKIDGTPHLVLHLTTSSLEMVSVSGASNVIFESQLETSRLDLEMTGASEITGAMKVNSLFAEVNGASKLDISGEANLFDIEAEGASDMIGFEFTTNKLKADLNGGSNISLVVNQKLDVKANAGSTVFYKGNGIVENQNLSGASEIIKMD